MTGWLCHPQFLDSLPRPKAAAPVFVFSLVGKGKGAGSGKLVEQANSLKHQWGEEEMNSQMEKDRNSEDEDEDKYADDTDMPGQNFDFKR